MKVNWNRKARSVQCSFFGFQVQLCFALLPILALADFYRVDTEVLADNDRRAEDVNKEEAVEARLEVEAEQGAEGFERSERDSDAQFLSLGGSSLLPGGVVASPNIGLVGAGHARHVNLGNGGVGLGGARLGAVGVASTGLGGVGLGGVGLGVGHRHVNLGSGVGLGGVSHVGHAVASPVVAAAPAVVASAPAVVASTPVVASAPAALHHNHVNLGATHAAVHAAPALVQQAPALVASHPAVHIDAAGHRHVNLGGGAQTTLAAAPVVAAPAAAAVATPAVVAPVSTGVHVDAAGVRHVNLGNAAHAVAHAAPVAVAHATPAIVAHSTPAVVAHAAPAVVAHATPVVAHAAPVAVAHSTPVVAHAAPAVVAHAAPAVVSHGVGHVSHGVGHISHGLGGHTAVHAAPAAVAVHTPVAQTAALAVHHHLTPAVVAHTTPVVAHAAPVVAATSHHHVPVTHTTQAVTYGAGGTADTEVYPDEIIPYSYEYTVSDPETNNNFNAVESDDGTGVRSGSYSVSLPDSRIQHVTYTTDADGYVATVTYEGTAVFPDLV